MQVRNMTYYDYNIFEENVKLSYSLTNTSHMENLKETIERSE